MGLHGRVQEPWKELFGTFQTSDNPVDYGVMKNVTIIDHPLVRLHLTEIRDKNTKPRRFRNLVQRLAVLTMYEATQDLNLTSTHVETPMMQCDGYELRTRIGIVPILRAGLGMVDPILNLLPEAEVWHLGFYRDEATLQPVEYYQKLDESEPVDLGIIVDPMLATGGSALAAIQALSQWGVPHIKMVALLASPEGIRVIHESYPDVQVYLCAIDSHLNDKGYILPGLGDAGDRIFNTLQPPA